MNLLDRIAYDTGGYTVQEILSSFCKKILEIVDLVNKNEEVCDESRTIIENIRNEVVPDLVEDIMKELQDSGYFDSLVNVTLIDQLRIELTDLLNQTITEHTTRLDNFGSQLEQITYNACTLGLKCDGSDETEKLQEIINNYNKVLIPRDVRFSTLELTKNYQEIKFDGKITIVDGGYGLKYGGSKNVTNTKVLAKNIIGESGAKCGVVFATSNFCELNAERIEGFDKGLYFDKDGNGTENRIKVSVIQLCNRDISIENSNTLTSKHEGNLFNVSCFSANTGVYIEKGCKYQHFQGVIDCAMTDNSMDIVDKSGANIFHLYYVRGHKVQLSNSLLYIFSNETGNQINLGKMAFGSNFISNYDEETMLSFKGYRFMNEEGKYKFKHIGLDGSQNNTSYEICEGGYFAIVKRLQGRYGGNFVNFKINEIIPLPQEGMFIDVIDIDSDDRRTYRFFRGQWVYFSYNSYLCNNVDINNGENAVITHNLNVDYTNLEVKLLVNDNGKFYPLESKLKYSTPNNNQIVIYNDHTTPLRILYIIKRIL